METIDLTPTWREILPLYVAVLEEGTHEGRKTARDEMIRMAGAADRWNASADELIAFIRKLASIEGEIGNPELLIRTLGDEAREILGRVQP